MKLILGVFLAKNYNLFLYLYNIETTILRINYFAITLYLHHLKIHDFSKNIETSKKVIGNIIKSSIFRLLQKTHKSQGVIFATSSVTNFYENSVKSTFPKLYHIVLFILISRNIFHVRVIFCC